MPFPESFSQPLSILQVEYIDDFSEGRQSCWITFRGSGAAAPISYDKALSGKNVQK